MRYVSHLACSACGREFAADSVMNLCPVDGRPVQMDFDLERLQAEQGRDGWWDPERRDLWRFGGLLPLDVNDPEDRRFVVSLGEGHTPCLDYPSSLADQGGFRLQVKDEGRHYPGFGANPTLSFKDRGMTMAVSKALEQGAKVVVCASTGNTSAASIPLATERLLREGAAKSGDVCLQIGFGAGLVYAAQVVVLP